VENQKALQTGALISQFTDAIEHQIDDFLADRVMTTCIIVR
jgi:hypothetical protein